MLERVPAQYFEGEFYFDVVYSRKTWIEKFESKNTNGASKLPRGMKLCVLGASAENGKVIYRIMLTPPNIGEHYGLQRV